MEFYYKNTCHTLSEFMQTVCEIMQKVVKTVGYNRCTGSIPRGPLKIPSKRTSCMAFRREAAEFPVTRTPQRFSLATNPRSNLRPWNIN